MLATPASSFTDSLSLTSTMMTRQDMSGVEVMEGSHMRSDVAIEGFFFSSQWNSIVKSGTGAL